MAVTEDDWANGPIFPSRTSNITLLDAYDNRGRSWLTYLSEKTEEECSAKCYGRPGDLPTAGNASEVESGVEDYSALSPVAFDLPSLGKNFSRPLSIGAITPSIVIEAIAFY